MTAPEQLPNPEVRPKARRRTFSAKYKLRVLDLADQCTKPGEIEALLRREGLYSSHLANWRKQCKNGQLTALSKKVSHPGEKREKQLAAELARVQEQLRKAQIIIEVQKKLCEFLETENNTEKPS